MKISIRKSPARRFFIDIAAVIALLIALPVFADENVTAQDAAVPDRQAISTEGFADGRAASGAKPAAARPATKLRSAVAEGVGSGFYIFGASVSLFFDDDRDGHFYGLDVTFDADTDFFAAEVYARLYLSYENGPWEEYYATDYFNIFGASGIDDYLVSTELFSGYRTGYYDVLIELYDSFDNFVASFGPDDSSQLSIVPLEDQQKDAPVFVPASTSFSRGGGGSIGVLSALLLFGFALRRRLSDLIA